MRFNQNLLTLIHIVELKIEFVLTHILNLEVNIG